MLYLYVAGGRQGCDTKTICGWAAGIDSHRGRRRERSEEEFEGRDGRCKPCHLFWLPSSLSLPLCHLQYSILSHRLWGSESNSIHCAAKINEEQKEVDLEDWGDETRQSAGEMHFLTAMFCSAILSSNALTRTNRRIIQNATCLCCTVIAHYNHNICTKSQQRTCGVLF